MINDITPSIILTTFDGLAYIENASLKSEKFSERWEANPDIYNSVLEFFDSLEGKIVDLEETANDFSLPRCSRRKLR